MTDYRMEFAERLNKSLDDIGMPERGRATELAKRFGVTPKGAGKWIKGEAIPETEKVAELSKWLNKSIQWLLTGEGSDIIGRIESSVDTNSVETVGYAPLLSWVQAGSWTDMESVNIQECEMLPLVPGAGKRSFYLEVRGLSNAPYFEEGEKICIDPDWTLADIHTGEMVVVRCGTEATFKALIAETDGYYLKPLNPNWSEQVIQLKDDCVLVGKYVGTFKPARRYFFNN